MSGPVTQSIRLRWRPELRFYEERISILRKLEERGVLQAFRVSEESVDAALPDWRWLSVFASGITLNVLTDTDDTSEGQDIIKAVIGQIAPLQFSRARVSYHHVQELPLSFDEAVARGRKRLYGGVGTEDVVPSDWALLLDLDVVGPPSSKGQVELGVVRSSELPLRLSRLAGRAPGMQHLEQREWKPTEFKDVSLFADSDLVCPAESGREEDFLDDACAFWSASRTQVGRLVEELSSKLANNDSGGDDGQRRM